MLQVTLTWQHLDFVCLTL